MLEALYRRIMRAHREKKTFRVIVIIPLLPGFQVLFLGNSPLLSYAGILFECVFVYTYLSRFFGSILNLEFDRGVWMTAVQHRLEL